MRRSREEMFAMISSWELSAETREQFCKRHDVTVATFSYWRSKYLKEHCQEGAALGNFINLQPHLSEQLEIIYPNGVRIRLPQNSPMANLQALVNLI